MNPMRLDQYGEDRLVAELVGGLQAWRREVKTGPGDDCAVIAERGTGWDRLLKTDAVVEGIHFLPSAAPQKVGWKALCRAISDIAAMGGEAEYALVTLGLRAELSVAWTKQLFRGLQRAALHYGIEIVGGETVRTTGPVFVSVSLAGRVEHGRALLRSGGKKGDAILVTGQLGGSIRSWHLNFTPRISEGRWLGKSRLINAMMDLSDGLGADLPRLANASTMAYVLFEKALPLRRWASIAAALNDGEDYELLLTAAAKNLPALLGGWRVNFPDLPLTVIGELTDRGPEPLHPTGGFHHF